MRKTSLSTVHPGTFIRSHVIPAGMTVTDAAAKLGVGRPALSNMLNGRSALSRQMAIRLEKAFGADSTELLERQAAFDRADRVGEENVIAVPSYVPDFLTIKARYIHEWPNHNLEARQLFAVLLRKLVNSTGRDLRRVDFPGYDNAEDKGWDGVVVADSATPWIPEAQSVWEFGVNQDPARKAEGDYSTRLKSTPKSERARYTFIFVTPRLWKGKTTWAKTKREQDEWKEVRAYDAGDLEQWLDVSVSARMWLAEKLGMPTTGFETLDESWRRWSSASEPEMSPAIFESAVTAHLPTFKDWLTGPSKTPFLVAADSAHEALAFLACVFEHDEISSKSRDLAVVFNSPTILRTLAASSSSFIPVVYTDDTERELATIYRQRHCIAVHTSNAVDSKPHVTLRPLDYTSFENALSGMGFEREDVRRYARESGCSPTVLRRRLSKLPAIRTPHWAEDAELARNLIPMTLVGAWHANSDADCEALCVLAQRTYPDIEASLSHMTRLPDAPIWSIGQYRGVTSKIDALHAIQEHVIQQDLNEFLFLAEYVLSEMDPSLELPEDRRWSAALYGKVRDHSASLRNGICETLVLLSVYGNNLFRDRIGIDIETCVSSLVQRLLTPLTIDKLLSHQDDLPNFAEAAPNAFLCLIEADLRQPEPVVIGLLKPVDSAPFSRNLRSGLLWALECLAWKHLSRVSLILAQLSRIAIDDNWVNKPIATLSAFFRSWMPRTAAPLEERIQVLELLITRYPDIGWKICVVQLDTGPQMAFPSHRPRWRNDASGAGQMASEGDYDAFRRKALDVALSWPEHTAETLGDLVERIHSIADSHPDEVWHLIDVWASSQPADDAKASLRKRIRSAALTRRGSRRGLSEVTLNLARQAYERLEPRDPVIRHAWLFTTSYIELSSDEIDESELNYQEHGEIVRKQRTAAIDEIWSAHGFDGLTALLAHSSAPNAVGDVLVSILSDRETQIQFLRRCFSITDFPRETLDWCIRGFLWSIDNRARSDLLAATLNSAEDADIVRLCLCAPFGTQTWRLLDTYDRGLRDQYWAEVAPVWGRYDDMELVELIDRLLGANRPRAAFHAVKFDWPCVETTKLKRILVDIDTSDVDPRDCFQLEAHDISEALSEIDSRNSTNLEELALLEFKFIDALQFSKHGIPNLERWMSEFPLGFVQALALVFDRDDGRQDPPEWQVQNSQKKSALFSAAHDLLMRMRRIPGTREDGQIDQEKISEWITETRRLCAEYGRADIGDQYIGELLSNSPIDGNGAWPCTAICDVMEQVGSEVIGEGFNIGVRRARGVTTRAIGEGGKQERELAAKYRSWGRQRSPYYPFAGSVLDSIAAYYEAEAKWHEDRAKINERLNR